MSIAPEQPQLHGVRLRPYTDADAERVAGWASKSDAYHLAPRAKPPIGVATIRTWGRGSQQQFMLVDSDCAGPIAYGEVNVLNMVRRSYWLGHLLLDPTRRGLGWGTALVRQLLERAFVSNRANEVALVVFGDNMPAIRAYHTAGMRPDGIESHYFPIYRRRAELQRFVMRRADWR